LVLCAYKAGLIAVEPELNALAFCVPLAVVLPHLDIQLPPAAASTFSLLVLQHSLDLTANQHGLCMHNQHLHGCCCDDGGGGGGGLTGPFACHTTREAGV